MDLFTTINKINEEEITQKENAMEGRIYTVKETFDLNGVDGRISHIQTGHGIHKHGDAILDEETYFIAPNISFTNHTNQRIKENDISIEVYDLTNNEYAELNSKKQNKLTEKNQIAFSAVQLD